MASLGLAGTVMGGAYAAPSEAFTASVPSPTVARIAALTSQHQYLVGSRAVSAHNNSWQGDPGWAAQSPSSTRGVTLPDGARRVPSPDERSVEMHAPPEPSGGTGFVVDPDAAGTSFPDGEVIFTVGDGAFGAYPGRPLDVNLKTIGRSNGIRWAEYSDGTTVTQGPRSLHWEFPDGRTRLRVDDGREVLKFPDGREIRKFPDGREVETRTTVQENDYARYVTTEGIRGEQFERVEIRHLDDEPIMADVFFPRRKHPRYDVRTDRRGLRSPYLSRHDFFSDAYKRQHGALEGFFKRHPNLAKHAEPALKTHGAPVVETGVPGLEGKIVYDRDSLAILILADERKAVSALMSAEFRRGNPDRWIHDDLTVTNDIDYVPSLRFGKPGRR